VTVLTGQANGLRRGQVAAAADVNIETLRYYERRGLLAEPERSPGGHRLYPSEAVTTLRVIKAAQRLGFTLDEVADLLELGRHRHGKRVDAGLQLRAKEKLVEVEERITDLLAIRDNLTAALDAGCDDLLACASSECCPIPFQAITIHPDSTHAPRAAAGEVR
jgi:DNA-binding transcriptional MerR regulator